MISFLDNLYCLLIKQIPSKNRLTVQKTIQVRPNIIPEYAHIERST